MHSEDISCIISQPKIASTLLRGKSIFFNDAVSCLSYLPFCRFFLAADTTGELWLSSDATEKNLKKVVAINGWTAHNEWLK